MPPRRLPLHLSLTLAALIVALQAPACTEAPTPAPAFLNPPPPLPSPQSKTKFDVGSLPTATNDPKTAAALRTRLATPEPGDPYLHAPAAVRAFYDQRAHQPAWIYQGRLTAAAVDTLRTLATVADHGLDPILYSIDTLAEVEPIPLHPIVFELQLTDTWLTVGAHLSHGLVDPTKLHAVWPTAERATALIPTLETSLHETSPGAALISLAPSSPKYGGLVAALRKLRDRSDTSKSIAAVEANLERWRWLPADLGARHVRVDLSTAELQLVNGTTPIFTTKITIGKHLRKTPLVSTTIDSITLDPEAKSPRDRFVFEMPDDHELDLGDIQLEDARALTLALLADLPEWTPARLDATLAESTARSIPLPTPVPLHVVYWTASVDDEGQLVLHEDPLARDRPLRRALATAPPPN